jgi:hypothetical protein
MDAPEDEPISPTSGSAQLPSESQLSEAHRARLRERYGLTDETVDRCGFSTVTRGSVIAQHLGWKYPARNLGACLAIPYFTADGSPTGHLRLRPDNPRKKNAKPVKYESRVGSQNRAYFPPGISAAINDPTLRLIITEGELKAVKAQQEGLATIAVAGVFNGQKKQVDGQPRELIDDLAAIVWNGRPAFIAFDSDIVTNRHVQQAEFQLAEMLKAVGASVKVIRIPPGPDGDDGQPAKVGLDDYLLNHTASDVEALIAAAIDAVEPESPPPEYFIQAGCMWHRSFRTVSKESVEVSERLCNFVGRIQEEQLHDDGAGMPERQIIIAGQLQDGTALEPITVSAHDFAGLSWLMKQWGAGPIVAAGRDKRDHTRAAIQVLSKQIARKTVYRHTGWREVNGAHLYLHAGGAIGAHGPVDDINVHLDGAAAYYRLPDPPRGRPLVAALKAVLRLWDLGPTSLIAAMLGTVFRAPLGNCDFGVHLAGKSGLGKSELLALVQQFHGPEMDRLHLPGSWTSTDNSLETLAHLLKDAVFAVDDFKPTGSRHLDDILNEKADRLFRGQGNQNGRGRCAPDGTLLAVRHPRGLVVSSGEETLRGESLTARVWQVPIGPEDIQIRQLTSYQRDATDGLYAECFSAYIRWLAGQMPDLHRRVPTQLSALREQLVSQLSGAHARTSGIVANLLLGLKYILEFTSTCGALDQTERDRLLTKARSALLEEAGEQMTAAVARSPEVRFIELIAALLESGHCYLHGELGGVPSCPHKWGWREAGDGAIVPSQSMSVSIGWIVSDNVYLNSAMAFAEARKLAEQQGDPLPVSENQLRKRLDAAGLLASKEAGKLTQRRMLNGAYRTVLHLSVATFHPPRTDGWTGDGEPGDAWEPESCSFLAAI